MSEPVPLWTPSAARVAASGMDRFRRLAQEQAGVELVDSGALHRWSVDDPQGFWSLLARTMLTGAEVAGPVFVLAAELPAATWFP
ncbi:MAG: acetoacetate--CoA ligase, partial [Actinomycetes bacterium]